MFYMYAINQMFILCFYVYIGIFFTLIYRVVWSGLRLVL